MEFAPICVYLVISLLLSLILIGVFFLFASSSSLAYPEKLSAYECGFDPLDNARSRFVIIMVHKLSIFTFKDILFEV
jgi:NADH-ubiquinone oxidoreductase chain 3